MKWYKKTIRQALHPRNLRRSDKKNIRQGLHTHNLRNRYKNTIH